MKEKESNKGYYTLIIIGSALLLLSAAYLLLQFVRGYDWCQSEFFGANGSAGNIGDFFSGTIGVLLSFISTVLVIYTIWQQNKQFKLAQEEQRQGRFEIAYYNLVGMIDKTRQASENTLDKETGGKITDLIGCYNSFKEYVKDKEEPIEPNSSKIEIRNKLEALGLLYDEYVRSNQCYISFYFRFIYNAVMFVVNEYREEKNGEDTIKRYLNILQSQMPDEELALLFYSSFSKFAKDSDGKLGFKGILDQYNFFQNIGKGVLLDESHYKLYPQTKFKFLNLDELRKVGKKMEYAGEVI